SRSRKSRSISQRVRHHWQTSSPPRPWGGDAVLWVAWHGSAAVGRITATRRTPDVKIILANPRGFCAGVNMAIDSLDRALKLFGTPVYVYHEIVHNRPVVERFRKQGVVFVDSIDEVPAGAHVLYSAHGVAPEIRKASQERNLHAIDATCPLVTKVHLE